MRGFNHTSEWRIGRRFATGSIPATLLASVVLTWLQIRTGGARHLITTDLSIAVMNRYSHRPGASSKHRARPGPHRFFCHGDCSLVLLKSFLRQAVTGGRHRQSRDTTR
jgi:hypothetical protein